MKKYKIGNMLNVNRTTGMIPLDFRNRAKLGQFEDFATTLYSKNFFIKNIEAIALQMIKGKIENSQNNSFEKTWSIIFGDIDGLKLTNDTLGHIEADIGIKNIAGIIKSCIRTHRDENDAVIYADPGKWENIPIRFGGDEFLIILPNCDKDGALLIKERIRKQIDDSKEHTRNMSLSMGIADTNEINIPKDIDNPEEIQSFVNKLVSLAEKRMYADKKKLYSDRKSVVLKYMNRIGEQVGFDFRDPEEIEAFVNIMLEIKSQIPPTHEEREKKRH